MNFITKNNRKELIHVSRFTHRPLSPTPSPAGRGEKKVAFTLAETPHRNARRAEGESVSDTCLMRVGQESGYFATNFGKTPRLLRSAGFTLAEVLITIGIIGVVSAMTIPNLITHYKAKQLRSQFLKSYSLVQQAFKQMEADDVSLNPQDYPAYTFYKRFMKYFNGSMECGTNAANKNTPCYNTNNKATNIGYKLYHGAGSAKGLLDDGQFVLPDGTNIMFENTVNSPIFISVDLNGYGNPPNRWGYDLFTFEFVDGELRAMGDNGTSYTNLNTYCYKNSTNSVNGIACAHLAKTNSDYFK
ncbi:type II secretion system protein, partial [bacterium]|nr:type II secretion system protein [bacterium]